MNALIISLVLWLPAIAFSAGVAENSRSHGDRVFFDLNQTVAGIKGPGEIPYTVPLPAKVTRPFESVRGYCAKEEPVYFKFVPNVPLKTFWETYRRESENSAGKDVIIFDIAGFNHVYVSIFPTLNRMNSLLGRPTVFLTEGGRILDHAGMVKPENLEGYIGHDLEKSLLLRFAKRFMASEEKMLFPDTKKGKVSLCKEASLWERFIWPKLTGDGNMILIGVSQEYALKTTVSHEIHHAFFYSNMALQKAVKEYWDGKVAPKDKRAIIKTLRSYEYDVDNDPRLLINEFFAYLLQLEADKNILSDFYGAYAGDLRKFIIEKGVDLPRI